MSKFFRNMSFFALRLLLTPLSSIELAAMDSALTDATAAVTGEDQQQRRTRNSAGQRRQPRRRRNTAATSAGGGSMSTERHDGDVAGGDGDDAQEGEETLRLSQPQLSFDEFAAQAHEAATARTVAIVTAATKIPNSERVEQFLNHHFPSGTATAEVLKILKTAEAFAQPEDEEIASNDENKDGDEVDTTMAMNIAKLLTYLGKRDNAAMQELSGSLFNNDQFLRRVIVSAHQDSFIATNDTNGTDALTADQEAAVRTAAGRAIVMLSAEGEAQFNFDEIVEILGRQLEPTTIPFVTVIVLHHARVAVDMQNAQKSQAHTDKAKSRIRFAEEKRRTCCPSCKEVACCCCGSAMGAAAAWTAQNANMVTDWLTTYFSSFGF